MLDEAHKALILEKGYEAVTIQDICDAAKVGRSTFYDHYGSKDDLRRSSFERLARHLAERQKADLAAGAAAGRQFGFSLTLLEHARDHIQYYRAHAGTRGGAVILEAIRRLLSDLVRNEVAATVRNDPAALPREFVVTYVVGAFMAVLTSWLDGGAKLPPQQVGAMFRQLVMAGITPPPRGPDRPR
jgi:AcrR family transcriptional regulator